MIASLEQFLRSPEPPAGQPLVRGDPGVCEELAGERAGSHVDLAGEVGNGDGLGRWLSTLERTEFCRDSVFPQIGLI